MFNKTNVRRKLAELDATELIKFIRTEFPSTGQDINSLNIKLQVLKSLNHEELSAAIARMSRIETACDVSKTISLSAIVVTSITLLFKTVFGDNSSVMSFLVILCVIAVYRYTALDKNTHTTAVYFKDLLIRIKSDK
ncbi:hypothetical protein LSG23_08785 [Bacillus velezensis]|uniref:hypothetical protein n=1 Tax=Bacillus TaxID=1386 RepID=UPI000206EF0B|nr:MULTISPECIES: hypothetical protein [Bacillus amyloliquefaciens group]AEB63904.1 SPBc2 prophage-derived uncharacterized protein yomK [Bacillus amyloliquefaciens LL3]AQS44083.1 hypothetical protein BVH55_09270 [Bacillus velezensis]QYJ63568.1 hypothetical protein J8615_10980 [Bacillus velezensis]UZD72448.1 hypothetical protein OM992_11460 [Bacillus siamensis]WNR79538.1 hypothetical protein RP314_11550 [Bacillus velezensis]